MLRSRHFVDRHDPKMLWSETKIIHSSGDLKRQVKLSELKPLNMCLATQQLYPHVFPHKRPLVILVLECMYLHEIDTRIYSIDRLRAKSNNRMNCNARVQKKKRGTKVCGCMQEINWRERERRPLMLGFLRPLL